MIFFQYMCIISTYISRAASHCDSGVHFYMIVSICNVACHKMPLEINTGGWGYYIGAYALYSARKSLSQWGKILQRLRCLQWAYSSLVEFFANHESIFVTIYRNIYITFARFEYFVTSFRTIGIINIFSWNSNSQMYGYLHCCKPKEHFHNG